MKKLYLALLSASLCVSAFAQKPVVVVDYFTSPSCTEAGVSALRGHVIAGLAETERINIIDVESEASLALEADRRSSEQALGDLTARLGAMKTLGANYIVNGVVSKIGADKKVSDDGKVYYTGNVVYTLKVVNTEDGTLVGSETYTFSSITGSVGSTQEEAVVATLKKANRAMKGFVSKYFKVSGAIVEMGEIKGGKAKTCYINLGTSTGVSKGTKCEVYEVKTIAGREAKVLIGTLTVEEVVADDLSSCKFVSGAPEILKAFQDGHPLTIVTKEKVTLTGIANAVGGIL